jgi:secernin
MCDTILASPESTADHVMLFGKNSDRQRNEAQTVEHFARADHPTDVQLKCTYVAIPQIRHTHSVLLCRPYWIWGAEMGANEHGVVIGNEGVQARSPAPQEMALTGMDLLRLALDRAATAAEAVHVITQLLERHGQGGNCGHLTPSYYNNVFMIADPTEAFVLETIGREWLVECVRGVHAISNIYSIGKDAERISAGLPALIRDSGWSEDAAANYSDVIADPQGQHIGHSAARRTRASLLLRSRSGQLSVANMMRILRDHGTDNQTPPHWHPNHESQRTICLHACADDCYAQTTGSMVSQLAAENAVHWVTGTSAPCTSIFKPVLIDVPLPPHGTRPTARFDLHSLWWRHERLHRAALGDNFGKFLNDIHEERDALEAKFYAEVKSVLEGGDVTERAHVVAKCWQEAFESEERWFARIEKTTTPDDTPYWAAWSRMNLIAGMDSRP